MKKLLLIIFVLTLTFDHSHGQELIGNPSSPPPPQFAMAPPPPCVEGQPGCDLPGEGSMGLMVLGLMFASYILAGKNKVQA